MCKLQSESDSEHTQVKPVEASLSPPLCRCPFWLSLLWVALAHTSSGRTQTCYSVISVPALSLQQDGARNFDFAGELVKITRYFSFKCSPSSFQSGKKKKRKTQAMSTVRPNRFWCSDLPRMAVSPPSSIQPPYLNSSAPRMEQQQHQHTTAMEVLRQAV